MTDTLLDIERLDFLDRICRGKQYVNPRRRRESDAVLRSERAHVGGSAGRESENFIGDYSHQRQDGRSSDKQSHLHL